MPAPSARVTADGITATNPPSTSCRPSASGTGTYQPGIVQLARIANGTSPSSFITTASPVAKSVATAANGIRSSSNFVTGKRARRYCSRRSLLCTPSRDIVTRPMSRQRSVRPNASISSIGMPAANAPATIDPADVPATQSIGISFSNSARNTPTWAMPRAAPPDSASPTFGGDIGFRPDSTSQSPHARAHYRETYTYQTQSSLPSASFQSLRVPARAAARSALENGPERAACKRPGSNQQSPSDLSLRNF